MPFLEEQENALNELNSIIHRWNNAHYDMESDTCTTKRCPGTHCRSLARLFQPREHQVR
jgi:hypothetical protein